MMNNLSVRQATLADLSALSKLFDRYRQYQGQASESAAAHSFLRARLENAESVLFIAESEGKAMGFAQLFPSFSSISLQRVFILNDLFVAESGRRQGTATALLLAVEAYAWSLNAARLTLNVARLNPAAQGLYEARGWKQDDVFFMYHRYPEGRSVDEPAVP